MPEELRLPVPLLLRDRLPEALTVLLTVALWLLEAEGELLLL